MKNTQKKILKNPMLAKPTFQIGKKGLTEEIIKEIRTQLKNKDAVKGKIYPSALVKTSKDNIIARLEAELDLRKIEKRGSVIVLYKKPKDFKKK